MKTYKEYERLKNALKISELQEYLKVGDKIDIEMAQEVIFDMDSDLEKWDMGIVQSRSPVDILDEEGLYETIWRNNVLDSFIYFGHCKLNQKRNYNPALSKKIYVCSPYGAKTEKEIANNRRIALIACKAIIERGNIPVAPHIYFPQFLNDNKESEREFAIQAGFRAMNECDEIWICAPEEKISSEMKREIRYASNYLGIQMNLFYSTEM